MAWMRPQIERAGIPFYRLPAFTPETVPNEYRERFTKNAVQHILPTNIASFASHLAAMTLAAGLDDDTWTLVLEDDVSFEIGLDQLNAIAAIATRENADIVRLSMMPKHPCWAVERDLDAIKSLDI